MKKYKGTIDELKALVESVGFHITEVHDKSKSHQIRTEEGAILNLFCNGTLSFQGKEEVAKRLQELLENSDSKSSQSVSVPYNSSSISSQNNKIFVVHGHDTPAREQLELVLHRLGLDPFVLQNTSGAELTIIEALEKEIGLKSGAARFGIVLMTPDDMGYSKAADEKEIQARARQNVVLEAGMLIAALGRPNVAILKKGHLELPSDTQGIIYIPFNDHVRETVPKLAERLDLAGFELDSKNISKASS